MPLEEPTAAASKKPWTEEDVRRVLPTDKMLAAVSVPYPDQQLIGQIHALARKAGLTQLPTVLVVPEENVAAGARARASEEGTFYIELAAMLSPRDALAASSHEIGHLKYGDSTPAGLAAYLNSPETVRMDELRADRTAVELCQGQQLANYMTRVHNGPDAAISGTLTPEFTERLTAIRDGAREMITSGQCLDAFKKMSADSGASVTTNTAPIGPISPQAEGKAR